MVWFKIFKFHLNCSQKSFNKPFEFLLYKTNRLHFSRCVYFPWQQSRHSTSSRVVLFCSLHALTSSVIYHSTHTRKNVMYLSNRWFISTNQSTRNSIDTSKILLIVRKWFWRNNGHKLNRDTAFSQSKLTFSKCYVIKSITSITLYLLLCLS